MVNRKKMIQVWLCMAAFVVAMAAFRVGFTIIFQERGREPAAIPKNFDFSKLKGEDLTKAARKRLAEGARVVTAGNSKGVSLGHFEVIGSNGLPTSACNVYDHIEMTFYADDMASGGEPCVMKLDAPCLPDTDEAVTSPILIQYDRVVATSPASSSMRGFDNPEVKATFQNVSDAWPHIWVLHEVRMYNSSGVSSGELVLPNDELRNYLSNAISLNF
jgi:hypothetical protein